MSETETWTIGRLLTWTADFLKKSGADSPRLDAEVLLAHARGCQRIQLYTAFDEIASDDLRVKFRELVKRRSQGAPVAYLVGRREFYSLSFRVTPEVLIPRPETEFLVIEALDALRQRGSSGEPPHVADVGTGSGCIAVSIAKHSPSARVAAIDASAGALEVAKANAAEHGVADRISFFLGDLLEPVTTAASLDVVVSNPPYIGEDEAASLPRDVIEHEPRAALFAGPCGDEVIARLIPQAADRLRDGGWLLLEISSRLETRVNQLIAESGDFETAATVKDLAGLPRVVKAKRLPRR